LARQEELHELKSFANDKLRYVYHKNCPLVENSNWPGQIGIQSSREGFLYIPITIYGYLKNRYQKKPKINWIALEAAITKLPDLQHRYPM
jgi:hypothetical protein